MQTSNLIKLIQYIQTFPYFISVSKNSIEIEVTVNKVLDAVNLSEKFKQENIEFNTRQHKEDFIVSATLKIDEDQYSEISNII